MGDVQEKTQNPALYRRSVVVWQELEEALKPYAEVKDFDES